MGAQWGTYSARNVLSYCDITMMPLLDTHKKLCAYANTVRLEETFAHNIAYLYLGVRIGQWDHFDVIIDALLSKASMRRNYH